MHLNGDLLMSDQSVCIYSGQPSLAYDIRHAQSSGPRETLSYENFIRAVHDDDTRTISWNFRFNSPNNVPWERGAPTVWDDFLCSNGAENKHLASSYK